jgi:hypothetical protein
MSAIELLHFLTERLSNGHEYVQLKVPRKSPPRNWDRARLLGVTGRCVGELSDGIYLFDMPLEALTFELTKRIAAAQRTEDRRRRA